MTNYVEEKGKLYEIDENGEKILVRSTDSESRAYLRFSNKTSRTVTVWWRDFQGRKHQYLCLAPRAYLDINTYITHPWEFTDNALKENYVVNNSLIFRPPLSLANMPHRTNWNITVTVRTLKYAAMLAVAERLKSLDSVEELHIPNSLHEDLKKLVQLLLNESRARAVR